MADTPRTKLGAGYADLDPAVASDLVAANHILADNGVLDSFGHVSVRDPRNPNRYLQTQAMAPRDVTVADIITFDLDSNPIDANGRSPYRERFIHGMIYKARPDVNAVVHSHSPTVIPFSVTEKPLRAIFHNGHFLGQGAPVWEIREHAGEKNNMLVLTQRARPLARAGARPGLGGADARPRQCGRRPRSQDRGVSRDLHRSQRQAADAGGDARRPDQFPQRIRDSSRRRTSTVPGTRGRNR